MSTLNEATLIGNVTNDPEIRTTQAGKKIANLTVATNEKWKDANGEKKERSEFHRIVVFSEGLVTLIENYIKKGDKLLVRGSIQTRKWQDKDGNDRYSTEIVLQGYLAQLVMLGGNRKEKDDAPAKAAPAAAAMLDDDSEIPF